ncbi:hypothetical protein HZQ56_17830 [Elizabethkingia anophelis]|nr:hypothetical protein [Elizabethkingia anophelis]MCT3875039.1 hypothetical protein [Elizabethkingia anophelis]
MYTITANIKAKKGDTVSVFNYRKKPGIWEEAEVFRAEIFVESDGKTYNSYEVVLKRKSDKGKGIWLYVGDDRIKPIETPKPPIF